MSYTLALRDLIKDPAVITELDRIAAVSKALETSILALGGGISNALAEQGLDTGKTIQTLPVNDAGSGETGVRWLTGPWLLGPNGSAANAAVLRPPIITSDMHNYSPLGIGNAIGLELTSDAAGRRITGINSAIRDGSGFSYARRLLFVFNAGPFSLIFPNNTGESIQSFSFNLGTSSDFLVLPPGRLVWFYFDPGSGSPSAGVIQQFWRLFALPAVPQTGLPSSLTAPFPPAYDWFASRIAGTVGLGIGEQAPTLAGAGTFVNDTIGTGRALATAAAPGAQAGVTSGGSSQVSPQHDFTWEVIVKTGASIADIRIWLVLAQSNPTDSDDFANQRIGFRYSTVVPDGGWVGVTKDSGAVQSVTTPVASIAANTIYKLRVRKSGSTVYFSVNDGAEVSKTTNMPDATAEFFWSLQWFSQAAAVKALTWYRQFVRFGISA